MSLSSELDTVDKLLEAWDNGDIIWSIECGGLGPGYEQAIQVAAVEFARACRGLDGMKNDDSKSTERFTKVCNEKLREIDKDLGGLSGAQFGAARWIAWQWCFNGGPARLIERAKEQQKNGDDRTIQVSKHWPKSPNP